MKLAHRNSDTKISVQLDALIMAIFIFIQSITPTLAAETINHPNLKRSYTYNNINTLRLGTSENNQNVNKPNNTMAPGGPDQPEVQSFTPVGNNNMVDPFSGDFSYNIPLLDIDGYPINIAYSAGISMDQEASWVGLGWNLNPGVINRNLRGLPDDFDGTEKITEEVNQKINQTIGATVGGSIELFGFEITNSPSDSVSLDLNASLGLNYNNYNGFEGEVSFGPSFSISSKFSGQQGLTFSGSSQGGASISQNYGFGYRNNNQTNGFNIGSSFNSREGMKQLTINYTASKTFDRTIKERDKNNNVIGTKKVAQSGSKSNNLGSFNFGQTMYSSKIPYNTKSFSAAGSFKLGPDVFGGDGTLYVRGFITKSALISNYFSSPAYGYFNLNKGQKNENALLDFTREKDASFTKNTPALPLTYLLSDIYTVSGHGINGNYRMDRSDIGYVFDAETVNINSSIDAGIEVGIGSTAKVGGNIGYVRTEGRSGVWENRNNAINTNTFRENQISFREASELSFDDSEYAWENIGADKPAYFILNNYNSLSNKINIGSEVITPNFRKSNNFKQNQPLTPLNIEEVKNGFGVTKLPTNAAANNRTDINHHIGAFTVTSTNGARYYYGLPAYNYSQIDISFAVGDSEISGLKPTNPLDNLIVYSNSDNSIHNRRGLDNFYNKKTTPNYIHSYLLTAYLSPDYVDSDNIPGPSKNDLGTFVEFKYKQIENFKWRNPINKDKAYYDEGLLTDKTDDKASFFYGEKELWYLDTIKTKNHIVICYTSKRNDAYAVNNINGGLTTSNEAMLKLDSLILYARPDFERNNLNAKAIKKVHFRYDYSLCKNFTGNINPSEGKLTLKKIWFTYEKSYKGERSPYEFTYGFNPNYNTTNIDRWGTYKSNPTNITNGITGPLKNSDYPYTGFNKVNVDLWAEAWNLKMIKLPSGGRIEVDYESDDYAFVQNKEAKQMFKIIGVEGQTGDKCSISDNTNKNRKIFFEMIPGTSIQNYGTAGELVYFRALLNMDKDFNEFDFVPGYAEIEEIGTQASMGYLILKPAKLNDNGPEVYNPMSVAGIQFARNYLSRIIPPSNQTNPIENVNFLDGLEALANSFASFEELFTGPNRSLWNKDIATKILINKSWIRLKNPNGKKLGGGHRVKEIRTYDAWNTMTQNGTEAFYGQQYIYEFDGKSSGVAAYEPFQGGDENTWRNPIAFSRELFLAPDSKNYLEEPFGEQLFPSASVGYSKVLIKNIKRAGVRRTATGHTINEFYTTKDFPTIVKRSKIDTKSSKFNKNLLLYMIKHDNIAVSQGFTVENNDMNGKQKSVEIYAEGQSAPYSSVKYFYQSTPITLDDISINVLDNNVKLINKDGSIKTATVGRSYDAISDFRENKTATYGGDFDLNLNTIIPFIYIPIFFPGSVQEIKTEFRSAVFLKSIERKGILYKTQAIDYNAVITTENLAYDYETGEVLLTSVTNGFKDTVYNFTYPAHWAYKEMNHAYKNLGYESRINSYFSDGYCTAYNNINLIAGDEVMLNNGTQYFKGWVTESSNEGVRILDRNGTPINGVINFLKVVRSGNRNLQTTPIGSITLMKNPLNNLRSNIFNEVLTAQSIEYGQNWKSYCDCPEIPKQNPYTSGRKGNWTPLSTYQYLANRTQSMENKNTNIRKDGVLTSFNPFFKLENRAWSLNKENWTYTAEVVDFSPFGQAIETKDALDRYSTVHYGYNQALSIAQVANSERRESGFDGFEDYEYQNCADSHFKLGLLNRLVDSVSHSGKYSLNVNAGNSILFKKHIKEKCDTEVNCDFSANIVDKFPTFIRIREGEDIQFDYEVIFGSTTPIIGEDEEGIYIYFEYSSPYKVNVKLTRSNGCFLILPITVN